MAKLEAADEDAAPAGPGVTHLAAADVAEAVAAAGAAAAAALSSADRVSDPELSTDFLVDPAYTTSEQLEEALKSGASSKGGNRDVSQTLKRVVIISGVAVAVVGAMIVVMKNLKNVS